ncbi:MAG: 16S rRNA (uracil(1498)-N(3))-methyltransferase [Caldilineaceae bacterium]|nr:16S rRNA (uracil(1498)-N(3))-methyltransferase [Caldilineaceae bacterium]
MHRFYLPDTSIVVGHPVDLTPLAQQLGRVLRLEPGAQIGVFTGDGYEYRVELSRIAGKTAVGRAVERSAPLTEPIIDLTLYQCSLKADKFEWVLQKGTELGVNRFAPVISARSIVRPGAALEKKYPRWRAILREAAEQSGRVVVPVLSPPLDLAAALARAAQAPGVDLLPYEGSANQAAAPRLADVIPAHGGTYSLLIGPEGGFEEGEIRAALAADWQIVSLGPRILRAETAAVASVAVMMAAADRA